MFVSGTAKTRCVARTAATLLICACARWLAANASAHDYWLEPSALSPARSEELILHLQMGDGLKTEEERPTARVRLEGGSALVVMDRKPRPITMEPNKFNQYLQTEGLDAIIAQRARLGQADAVGR